jgi:3-dehydroquinate synthase
VTGIVRVGVPGGRGYDVRIGRRLLGALGSFTRQALPGAESVALVADSRADRPHGATAAASLEAAGFRVERVLVPSGEASKSFDGYRDLLDRLVGARLERSSPLVALGGGVVGDLAGFAAATYLRGVPLVMAPTTLLAMVDSSVGGKTGIDHASGKNLIGAFHAPALVVADVDTLATLDPAEIVAGAAEVVKYGVIRDRKLFEDIEAAGVPSEMEAMAELVLRCVAIKADVVERDEREGDLRRILNFGHTVGHAVEKATGFARFRHGEAVAMGMVAAAHIADANGVSEEKTAPRIEALLRRIGLPTGVPPDVSEESILEAISRDKKARSGRVHFVLPRRIGEVVVTANVERENVRAAIAAGRAEMA